MKHRAAAIIRPPHRLGPVPSASCPGEPLMQHCAANLGRTVSGGFLFAAADLTANGVAGLSNAAPDLMVSSVSSTSTHQGILSLVTTQAWVRRYDSHGHDSASIYVTDQYYIETFAKGRFIMKRVPTAEK